MLFPNELAIQKNILHNINQHPQLTKVENSYLLAPQLFYLINYSFSINKLWTFGTLNVHKKTIMEELEYRLN